MVKMNWYYVRDLLFYFPLIWTGHIVNLIPIDYDEIKFGLNMFSVYFVIVAMAYTIPIGYVIVYTIWSLFSIVATVMERGDILE